MTARPLEDRGLDGGGGHGRTTRQRSGRRRSRADDLMPNGSLEGPFNRVDGAAARDVGEEAQHKGEEGAGEFGGRCPSLELWRPRRRHGEREALTQGLTAGGRRGGASWTGDELQEKWRSAWLGR